MNLLISITAMLLAGLATTAGHQGAQPRRENIEWCNMWVPDVNSNERPRVLLIGDSITQAYYPHVAQALKARANVAYLTTSAAVGDRALLDQVRMILTNYHFDVIHLNNGLHGMDNTEVEYRKGLRDLVRIVKTKAPDARLIWATTTPLRKPAPDTREMQANNEKVLTRNRIAADLMAKEGIESHDLYSLVKDHPEYSADDGVHFRTAGQQVEAEQVTASIERALGGGGR